MIGRTLRLTVRLACGLLACGLLLPSARGAEDNVWRFDCGTAESPVAEGYTRLTAAEKYDATRGYGWETPGQSVVFGPQIWDKSLGGSYGRPVELREHIDRSRNPLNNDAVISDQDLTFRLDVPKGVYRVAVTIADMSQPIGSMDMYINGVKTDDAVTAWAVGCYRLFQVNPAGWWVTPRNTVDAKDGVIRITLKKNQTYYDQQMAEQAKIKTPYAKWYHAKPVIDKPPYFFIGAPFIHNSIAAIDVTPLAPAPIAVENDKMRLVEPIQSPALARAVEQFNAKDFPGAFEALKGVAEPEAQAAKAVAELWLAGRLECEQEKTLVPEAIAILKRAVTENPKAYALAENLQDAEIFENGLTLHLDRGRMYQKDGKWVQRVHFIENDKALGQWWLIQKDSPLYYKTQLYIARAAHMLHPYFPTIATEGEIFKELEKKFPDNRFVKYHLRQEWTATGDGSNYYDWFIPDYQAKADSIGGPEWAKAAYQAYAGLVDLAEWWIKFKQYPEGNIGGGWGDDVEMVGLFGYYGYVSRGVSDLAIKGTRKLVNGVWNTSEVDPETGFCMPMADAEHSAEWTGDTLGMMVQIDYGNPAWIERSMKTAKLMRDLWTDLNAKGQRHFRSNYFGATQIGEGDQMNDSFINYRAVSPATAVLNYNLNPAIAKLYLELADAWLADALSTDRGKPKGVIPAQVSFPEGILGGTNAPNWWKASHPAGSGNYDWWNEEINSGQDYKVYLINVLMAAYDISHDAKYLEPLKLEYELAVKNGYKPSRAGEPKKRNFADDPKGGGAEPGSELWTAARLMGAGRWLDVDDMLKGRSEGLKDTLTKDEIIKKSRAASTHMRENWPMMTTEAGPTDRVGFLGESDPFFIYTGGSKSGPLLHAAVTYENTSKDFAAAVLAHDPQGFRIAYYSFAPEAREIGLLPWDLQPGAKYRLSVGEDGNDDGAVDKVLETREFVLKQVGAAIPIAIQPRVNYLIEIDQIEKGKPAGLAADPALADEDIRYAPEFGLIVARIHNIGSKPVHHLKVAFYDGDPKAGGTKIGESTIPNLEAPLDMEPRWVNVGIRHDLAKNSPKDIYVAIDPDQAIQDEITDFNNVAHAVLPEAKQTAPASAPAAKPPAATGAKATGRR